MLAESIKTIKAQLYERASSPLFSVFIISWCLWNYRFIMVISSKSSISEKFIIIDNEIFTSLLVKVEYCLLLPLLTTAFMLFVYPYPAKYVYKFWRNRQKELKDIRQKIEDETPLTIEEAKAIRKEALKLELEYESELKKKNEDIKALKEIIAEKQKNGSEVVADMDKASEYTTSSDGMLDNSVIKKYLDIVASSRKPYISGLEVETGDGSIKTRYILDELVNMKLLSCGYDQDLDESIYSLTHKGREAIIFS